MWKCRVFRYFYDLTHSNWKQWVWLKMKTLQNVLYKYLCLLDKRPEFWLFSMHYLSSLRYVLCTFLFTVCFSCHYYCRPEGDVPTVSGASQTLEIVQNRFCKFYKVMYYKNVIYYVHILPVATQMCDLFINDTNLQIIMQNFHCRSRTVIQSNFI
jgi:hypothetical protein